MKEETQFRQWEGRIFGFGYGTGEAVILPLVKKFFELLEDNRSYNYERLEDKLGKENTWFLINCFGRGNVIEYGTSPRYGWLTSSGEFVRDFVKSKSNEELYEITTESDETICECDGKMHQECSKNPMVYEKYADELKYKMSN